MIASSALAVACAVLIVLGLRPRRRGDTPFCRACGYNLTGLDRAAAGVRCPECGADIATDAAIVRGTRHLRRGLIATGAIGLALGLAAVGGLLYGEHKQVDWYSHLPTALILRDARGSDATQALRALLVLDARLQRNELDVGQMNTLAEAALMWKSRPSLAITPVNFATIGPLVWLYERGQLTPEQAARFFASLVELRPDSRPKVLCTEPVAIGVEVNHILCPAAYCIEVRVAAVLVDGIAPELCVCDPVDYDPGRRILSVVILDTPGVHEILTSVDIRVRRVSGTSDADGDAPALHTETRVVRGVVEVFAEATPELFRTVRSPELDQAISEGLRLSEFRVVAAGADVSNLSAWERTAMLAWVKYDTNLPVDFAFDVIVSWGSEMKLRSCALTSDSRGLDAVSVHRPAQLPTEVDVILRCSKARAINTTGIFEIWEGELHFKAVPVVEVSPSLFRTPWWQVETPYRGQVESGESCDDTTASRPRNSPSGGMQGLHEYMQQIVDGYLTPPASAPTAQP